VTEAVDCLDLVDLTNRLPLSCGRDRQIILFLWLRKAASLIFELRQAANYDLVAVIWVYMFFVYIDIVTETGRLS
jgi:hypothetical protein